MTIVCFSTQAMSDIFAPSQAACDLQLIIKQKHKKHKVQQQNILTFGATIEWFW